MEEDRRKGRRFEVWFPMRFEPEEGGTTLAVSHNVSKSGMLMATAERLEEGAPVKARFSVPPNDEEHELHGRVVRFEKNESDPEGLWPYRVAVEFSEVHPELEPLLETSLERQSRPPD